MDSEQNWIEAAKRGDTLAFGFLIERHEKTLYRTVYRMVRDRDDAREVVQEAMVRAWENLPRFRGEAPFVGWLSRIAIHLALNHLRQQKKFVRPQDAEQHEAVLGTPQEPGSTPLTELLGREEQAALEKALQELPDDFRIPLVLRVYEEYSYDQIATALDLPLGTVMSRLFRARERLAQRVRELLDG